MLRQATSIVSPGQADQALVFGVGSIVLLTINILRQYLGTKNCIGKRSGKKVKQTKRISVLVRTVVYYILDVIMAIGANLITNAMPA